MVTVGHQTTRPQGQKSTGALPVDVAPRTRPKDTRTRVMLRFFLDLGKQDELELLHEAETLKKERHFAPTLRDGLRLMRDLRAGQFDALFDLFDWIPKWIESEVERRINERLMDTNNRLTRVEAELAALRGSVLPAGQGASAGPRPLTVPPVPGPVEDDDEPLVVTKVKSDGKASAANFLKSAFNLLQ